MKFVIKKASTEWKCEIVEEVDITTLEELKAIAKKHAGEIAKKYDMHERVIVNFETNELMIYDDYIE